MFAAVFVVVLVVFLDATGPFSPLLLLFSPLTLLLLLLLLSLLLDLSAL
jgi:hypothetical protein